MVARRRIAVPLETGAPGPHTFTVQAIDESHLAGATQVEVVVEA
jgi:hypothetical protein